MPIYKCRRLSLIVCLALFSTPRLVLARDIRFQVGKSYPAGVEVNFPGYNPNLVAADFSGDGRTQFAVATVSVGFQYDNQIAIIW